MREEGRGNRMYVNLQEHRVIQIELVDNWHPRWREVQEAIAQVGQRDSLHADSDGWLSARHNLLVAFVNDAIAGHLSFRVQIAPGSSERPAVEAVLESHGVQPGFSQEEVEALLFAAAEERARALRYRRLVAA